MIRIRLVEVTHDEPGWKGTWYRRGQRHFVQQDPWWPSVMSSRWHALTPNTWGGIPEADCRVLSGPIVWLRCQWFRLRHWRDASWCRPRARGEL